MPPTQTPLDTLRLRLFDSLIDDDEQLEEIYLHVNFARRDHLFVSLREQYRLVDIIARLKEMERGGLIRSILRPDWAAYGDNIAARSFDLTEVGRTLWLSHAADLAERFL